MKSKISLQIFRKSDNLLSIYLILAILEGIVSIIILLSIPSDPTNASLLYYSPQRLMMLAVMFFLLLFFIVISIKMIRTKRWGKEVAKSLIEDRKLLPQSLLVIIMLAIFLLSWMVIFKSDVLQEFNEAYLLRLAPLMAWLTLLIMQIYIVWSLFQNPEIIFFYKK